MAEAHPHTSSVAPRARRLDPRSFRREFDDVIVGGPFQETADYYARYRSRYEHVMAVYAAMTPGAPVDVFEVGGGQHALLAHRLWGDRAVVGDLAGPHHAHLEDHGVPTLRLDLAIDDVPFVDAFDRVFLCEVIAHVSVPPHVYLAKLRDAMRAGGRIIVTTPNLHRLRNLAFLALGRDPWGYFARTSGDHFFGMYLDYSRDHLTWQLETAGFTDVDVALVDFPHQATTTLGRVGNVVGKPLLRVPRFRQGLVAVGTA
jgi:SAM-dependent methyltransferase